MKTSRNIGNLIELIMNWTKKSKEYHITKRTSLFFHWVVFYHAFITGLRAFFFIYHLNVATKIFSDQELSRNLFWFVHIFIVRTNRPRSTIFHYTVPSYTFVSQLCYIRSIPPFRRGRWYSWRLKNQCSLFVRIIVASTMGNMMVTLLLVDTNRFIWVIPIILTSKALLLTLLRFYLLKRSIFTLYPLF